MHSRLLFLWIAVLASAIGISAQPSSPIEGTWRWKFTMPDGSVPEPKLKLALKEGKLTGTSVFPGATESSITNASFVNNEIRFQIIRERDGNPIVTTYTGHLAGKQITGKVQSNWAGEARTYDWIATRSEGADGTWKWNATFGGRQFEMRANLKQDGTKLDGTLPSRRGGRSQANRIKNGSIKDDGELYFEVETGFQESRSVSKYKGKLIGDRIQGTIESNFGGTPRKSDWVAQRAD